MGNLVTKVTLLLAYPTFHFMHISQLVLQIWYVIENVLTTHFG